LFLVDLVGTVAAYASVIPAKAGIHSNDARPHMGSTWIPAFARMTVGEKWM